MKTDEDKCFEDFMNYLFREKIEPKLIRFMHESYSPELPSSYTSNYSEPSRPQTQYTSSSPITYPSDFEIRREMANWKFPLSAAKAMSVINHINYHCSETWGQKILKLTYVRCSKYYFQKKNCYSLKRRK